MIVITACFVIIAVRIVLSAACCVLRAACCVLRAACCVLRAACCVLRAACVACCVPPLLPTTFTSLLARCHTARFGWMPPGLVLLPSPACHPLPSPARQVLWELVCYREPYPELSTGGIVMAVSQRHQRLAFPPSTPRSYVAVVRQGWHPDPARRPDASLILATLQRMQDAMPPERMGSARSHDRK